METSEAGEKLLFIEGNLRAKILHVVITACAFITLTFEIAQHAIGFQLFTLRYGMGIWGSIGQLLFTLLCFLRCKKPGKQWLDYLVFGVAFLMIVFSLLIISYGIRSINIAWEICKNNIQATSVGNCSPAPVALETVKVTEQFLNLFLFLFYIIACIKNFCKRYYEKKYNTLG